MEGGGMSKEEEMHKESEETVNISLLNKEMLSTFPLSPPDKIWKTQN